MNKILTWFLVVWLVTHYTGKENIEYKATYFQLWDSHWNITLENGKEIYLQGNLKAEKIK